MPHANKKTAPARAAFVNTRRISNKNRLDFQMINRAALNALPVVLQRWLPDGKRIGNEWKARNPRRADQHAGSFSINMVSGRWADFATGDAGNDVISLTAYLANIKQIEAARNLALMLGMEVSHGR